MTCLRHIAVAIPLPYSREGDFWGRDAGLLVRGFREIGCRATLVALHGSREIQEKEGLETDGLLLATKQEMETASWWKALAPDGVVLFGWALHHFEKIRRAAAAATPCLAERMDTDGMRSPLLDPARFFYLSWARSMDHFDAQNRLSWKALPAGIRAAAWTAYSLGAFPFQGANAAKIASQIPVLLVESNPALEKIRRWLGFYGHSGGNLHFCPPSVDVSNLPKASGTKKKPERIVAVGRWGSFQKNFPLTWQVASRFVSEQKDYEFHFVGELPRHTSKANGIVLHGKKSRGETGHLLSTARILFAASRYESFHLAAAEALCCGCSVVLPRDIPTAQWFASHQSGISVPAPNAQTLTNALIAEAGEWKAGHRAPEAISAHWRQILHPRTQAAAILDLWEKMPPGPPPCGQ